MLSSGSTIVERYVAANPGSAALYREAVEVFPSGVTHDSRYLQPFPPYITRAAGSHKWDVDGHEIVDYAVGHGALLLGHSHPAVVAAVTRQVALGTHYGAGHDLELRWAQLVRQLVPSAEQVKLVSSGTEATMMALRLARASTGRTIVAKLEGHFHGWHDYATVGVKPPFDRPTSSGIPAETLGTMAVLPASLEAVRSRLARRDVAGIILEPTGASMGTVPLPAGFLEGLREVATETGTLLIFDEVVTGFRVAPGGVQEATGVTPDLTTLAKVLAGGLPGGAVAGRRDVMGILEFRADASWNRGGRIAHPGTFNANPLSAASGVAALEIVATGAPGRRANALGEAVRAALNDVLAANRARGCVYGTSSMFHVLLGNDLPEAPECLKVVDSLSATRLLNGLGPLATPYRCGMLLGGVDGFSGQSALLSAAHTEADVEQTARALEATVQAMRREGMLA